MVPNQMSTIQQNGHSTLGLSLPRAKLGPYHRQGLDIYHSTEWSLNIGLSLHRGPRPGGPILLREWLLMLLRKINTPSQQERHSLPYQGCHECR